MAFLLFSHFQEEESSACTDGSFAGRKLFDCPPKKAFFVYLHKVVKDQRFAEHIKYVEHTESQGELKIKHHWRLWMIHFMGHRSGDHLKIDSKLLNLISALYKRVSFMGAHVLCGISKEPWIELNKSPWFFSAFGSLDCPEVEGTVSPIEPENLNHLIGKHKGIQVHMGLCGERWEWREGGWEWLNLLIQCSAVITQSIFLWNSHNWYPIAHPAGWAIGCLLWGQSLIYVLHQTL